MPPRTQHALEHLHVQRSNPLSKPACTGLVYGVSTEVLCLGIRLRLGAVLLPADLPCRYVTQA
eukprot:1011005-Amphidinium_carterae.1